MVEPPWQDVARLREAVPTRREAPVVQAFFATDEADWRLVVVYPSLASVRPVYSSVHESLKRLESDLELVSHLVVIDASHPDARSLLRAPAEPELPPRSPTLVISSLPGFRGVVVERDQILASRLVVGLMGQQVRDVLEREAWTIRVDERLDRGMRTDMIVETDAAQVLVEIISVEIKNFRNRWMNAAGVANLIGSPVVLVVEIRGTSREPIDGRSGTVPVFVIDWRSETRVADLIGAVKAGLEWST